MPKMKQPADPRVEEIVAMMLMLAHLDLAYAARRLRGQHVDTDLPMANDVGITALIAAEAQAKKRLAPYGINYSTSPLKDLQYVKGLTAAKARPVVLAELAAADTAKAGAR